MTVIGAVSEFGVRMSTADYNSDPSLGCSFPLRFSIHTGSASEGLPSTRPLFKGGFAVLCLASTCPLQSSSGSGGTSSAPTPRHREEVRDSTGTCSCTLTGAA